MKIAIIIGTRPEIIKMSPVIRGCIEKGIPFFIIHSNQHYSHEMDAVFFDELGLPAPDYNLHVGSGLHGNQTGNILMKMEPILIAEKPDVVLVQGDTNTVLAGAMAASKLNIPVGHIEAGLRSYDRTMPEETNRIITDHISRFLFTVTDTQTKTLKEEGIQDGLYAVGNTVADALFQNMGIAEEKSKVFQEFNLEKGTYGLLTAHRSANVDRKEDLQKLIAIVETISKKLKIVWPMHVRTRKYLDQYQLNIPENVLVTGPIGYLDFILLEKHAQVILTDSGGLQEEACILDVPCITLRENTERPETLEVGANKLVGLELNRALEAFEWAMQVKPVWKQPFGNGQAGIKIIEILQSHFVSPKKVTVIGLGYMGLPTAALLATAGHSVFGVDVDRKKIDVLQRGKSPLDEPGILEKVEEALASGHLRVGLEPEPADIFIIAVPTPAANKKCDLKYVLSGAQSVRDVAKDGDIVILESTVKPGTCRDILVPFFEEKGLKLEVVHCPERAIPGQTHHELVHNDRVIGADTRETQEKVAELYRSFVKGELLFTDPTTAEMAKLMENTYRDVNIALANEFELIARERGVNIRNVIALANRHPRVNILSPGPGVGGHCIPIDPWFLGEDSQAARLILAAREINDARPGLMVDRFAQKANLMGAKKIGVLGVAYKPDVDDARETPALPIFDLLMKQGFEVRAHDPYVQNWVHPVSSDLNGIRDWADLLVVVTHHLVYAELGIPDIMDL